jgi:DNA (cytosine-5)-methyltransferase 1
MITKEIRKSLLPYQSGRNFPSNTVLIGGPPCQAYSVVGRARNKGQEGYVAEKDNRHFLYLEYLHVISEFKPAVFVMENVKGILSSKVNDGNIFHRILDDLRNPSQLKARKDGSEYVLLPLVESKSPDTQSPEDFIVKAELFGIPQARHRVIILGIRRDVYDRVKSHPKLQQSKKLSVNHVIDDLPSLSPEVSKRGAGINFNDALLLPIFDQAICELERSGTKLNNEIAGLMKKLRAELRLRKSNPGPGRDRIRFVPRARKKSLLSMNEWYKDRNTNLITNHESRSHMPSDLVRYMFVSAYGKIAGESPRLKDFPKSLLPAHKNVIPEKLTESIFNDRFRVQIGSRYSTTITSHIAKDGHAFIHYNPKQCRSLSVREAARLQTFPDTYVFLGNRTAQYTQVGNAVPPKLANQIADVVASILKQAGLL